jgi:NAD(P)-dependent dehydrogenase (short-subunit alcohol dehydrogenase family)
MSSPWTYEGKRVSIVGCASGMGEATARELVRLGAEVHGADVRPSSVDLSSFVICDLTDPASIGEAVETIGGTVDAVFNCAGLPGARFPALDVMKANFMGTRLWTELWVPRMPQGGAIVSISSTVAFRYADRLQVSLALVAQEGFEAGVSWCEENADVVGDGYGFSKEALIAWTMASAAALAPQGIRINCTSPAPTQTPMMEIFEEHNNSRAIDVFALPIGRRSTSEEQAYPLVFLNSDAAGYISGHNLVVDGGFSGSVETGRLDVMQLVTEALST